MSASKPSKRVTVHNAEENDFHNWGNFLSRFYSNITGKIKLNHIFSVRENSLEMNPSGLNGSLMKTIKESDLEDASVIQRNCIKRTFERDENLSFENALLDRKNYITQSKENKMKVLESPGLNSWKAVMLFKNYRQHVAVEWQEVTCPEPSKEQLDSYNVDTVRNVEKRKQKKEQKRKVKLELDKKAKLRPKKLKNN